MVKHPADLLLQEYVECADPERAGRLLETLLAGHAQPAIRAMARRKLGPESREAEDIASEALIASLDRLRTTKSVETFAALVAAASQSCGEYLRRKQPDRHRLKTRLRYLLGAEKDLAIWQTADSDWLCGLARWQTDGTPAAPPETVARCRESAGDPSGGNRARHPADLVALVLRRLGGPVELDEFAGIMARMWVVADAPPPPENLDDETLRDLDHWIAQFRARVRELPEAERSALLLRLPLTGIDGAQPLELDSALAACSARQVRAIRAEVSGHLDYAGVVACSEGRGAAPHIAHLRDCAMCQPEVVDLSRFRTKLAEKPRANRPLLVLPKPDWTFLRIPLGIAAAVALLVAGGIWTAKRRPAPSPVAQQPGRIDTPLPPAERRLLEQAIAAQRLDRAPVLDRLIVKPARLPGAPPRTAPFHLISPVGTTVLTDRPLLRWTPAAGATSYAVAIFDEKFEKVVESPAVSGTDWSPSKPLPRGKVLIWQVTAKTRGGAVREPRPPAPEARFEVVSTEAAAHIQQTRSRDPGNPLLMAVLCAEVGALDDAGEALKGMDPSAAQRYRESLANIRNSE